ncbi:unnamed protein product [Notodromas monacha]|uniref:Uncharacterized protein n=1 Tax=Notodromas monacha TaxID=399045 RepID=A0A7R9GDH2_9CRUS|nr:unnamed protein product [Notodromas monacha]CAG0917192.1 unnamed protein product [Notodromas monacha]
MGGGWELLHQMLPARCVLLQRPALALDVLRWVIHGNRVLGFILRETRESEEMVEKLVPGVQITRSSNAHLKYLSLLLLTGQNALEGIMVRYSRVRTNDLYITSTATLMVEVAKLFASMMLLAHEEGGLGPALRVVTEVVQNSPVETLKVALISLVYVIQNNFLFVAASNLDVATFQVTYQMKILTTALFFVFILQTRLIRTQWLALFTLTAGIALVQLANIGSSSANQKSDESAIVGLSAVIFACCLSGFAGVYFEKILKSSVSSVWLRNVQLSFLSIPLALAISAVYDADVIIEKSFFFGYDYYVMLVIVVKASGGLIVALVVKYADNILKGFSTSIAIIIGCIANVMFFGVSLSFQFLLGTALVIFSVFLYGYKPPVVISENRKTDESA